MDDSSKERSDVIEIGDLPDDKAVKYLTDRGVSKEHAQDAVANILGGRLIRLHKYAKHWTPSTSNAEYRKGFDTMTGSAIEDAKLPKDHTFFKYIVQHGQIGEDNAKEFINKEQLVTLVKKNVLSAHDKGICTFHSLVVETYFRQAVAAAAAAAPPAAAGPSTGSPANSA